MNESKRALSQRKKNTKNEIQIDRERERERQKKMSKRIFMFHLKLIFASLSQQLKDIQIEERKKGRDWTLKTNCDFDFNFCLSIFFKVEEKKKEENVKRVDQETEREKVCFKLFFFLEVSTLMMIVVTDDDDDDKLN